MKKIFTLIFLVIFFILAISFAYKNDQLTNLNYYAGLSIQAKVSSVVFAIFGIGLILGYLLSISAQIRNRGKMKNAQKQAKDASDRLQKIKDQDAV